MSNSYFQFKQFTIVQERGAMKVTTDACIQGAWTPVLPGVKYVLDIGAGTGLLSLMLAQRSNDVVIDAMELDAAAADEARTNVAASPWKERIKVLAGDVRGYSFGCKYDMIITNPPFFNNSLLGEEDSKNMARHTLSLSYSELLKAMDENLVNGGVISVLLPAVEYEQWRSLAVAGDWFECGRLTIRHKEDAAVKRIVGLFCKKEMPVVNDELVIMDGLKYSQSFIDLLSPFYLNL